MSNGKYQRVLILPDTHNKWERAEQIIQKEKADKIICLGDFFDSFEEKSDSHIKTAKWLKSKLHEKNFLALRGNHDIHYEFPVTNATYSSGYDESKRKDIRSILTADDWRRFSWFTVCEGWLLTHAGLTLQHMPPFVDTLVGVESYLAAQAVRANMMAATGAGHWFYAAGMCRGGAAPFGGILWCDFTDEFTPVPAIKQIFGHTPIHHPTWLREMPLVSCLTADNQSVTPPDANKDWNLCLDTHLMNYVIMQDGVPTIHGVGSIILDNYEKQYKP